MGAVPSVRDTGVVGRGTAAPAVRVKTAIDEGARKKPVGYGLPCSKCRTYYPADLTACPICKSSERVSISDMKLSAPLAPSEELPDPEMLEQEREKFLR
jgi:hypothetical protein